MTLANEIIDRFKNFKTFTFRDIKAALSEDHKGISDKTIQVTVSRMAKKRALYRIIKGIFSLKKRDEVVGFAFSPFYYGGLSALMIRNMIDDQVKMEIMTTDRIKHSFIKIYNGSSSVVLHHIPRKYYFGFTDFKYGDIIVPVSDPEKTLIDLFYYKEKLSLQDYSGILKSTKERILKEYLMNYDKRTKLSVMRFVKTYKPLALSGKLENKY